MDAPESITVNAEYHARLLSTIAGLEYVPQARKDQIEYVKDLGQQVESGKARISELAQKTKKERKEHEAIRDSVAKRFAHLLVGKKEKYAQKASKEEREYVEALEHEMSERDTQNTRLQMYEEGKGVLEDLEGKEARYESAKVELHALYAKIFDGPTEAFPEEDRLEYGVIEATKRHEQAQSRLNTESRVAELLARANSALSQAYNNAREALGYSSADMWGFRGSNMSDYLERNALRNADVYAHQAKEFVGQARRINPDIQPIPRLQIAQGAFLGDMLFDNFLSDVVIYDRIRLSIDQLSVASKRVTVERNGAMHRTELAGAALVEAAKDLEARRQELDAFRRATFESYAAQNPPPPGYDDAMAPVPTTANPSTDFKRHSPVAENDDEVDRFFQNLPTRPAMATQSTRVQMPTPYTTNQIPTWGSRNPFAFAMSEQTRQLSI